MRGTIQVRTLTDGKTKRYDVVWRAGGKQHWKTFEKKKKADRYLTKVVGEVHDGSFREVQPELMETVFKRWMEVRLETEDELKPSTKNSYRSAVEKHFIPRFGNYRSDQLTPAVVEAWRLSMIKKERRGKVARKTYNNLHALLSVTLAWAREPAQSLLKHDPMEGIKRMKIDRAARQASEVDFLQPDEMTALLKAAKGSEESAVVHLGLFCGLRRGELFGLKWDCIDRGENDTGGQIHVRQSISAGVLGDPKTDNSRRVVDAPPDVLDALARHREACGSVADDEFVFQSKAGTPADPDNWSKRTWSDLRKRAGLRPSIGLHSLRHSFASLLIDQGENPRYVADQLGHSSPSFTLEVYAHCFKKTSDRAMGRLQKTIRAAKRRRFEVVGSGSI